jgi:hypothetical protein
MNTMNMAVTMSPSRLQSQQVSDNEANQQRRFLKKDMELVKTYINQQLIPESLSGKWAGPLLSSRTVATAPPTPNLDTSPLW